MMLFPIEILLMIENKLPHIAINISFTPQSIGIIQQQSLCPQHRFYSAFKRASSSYFNSSAVGGGF